MALLRLFVFIVGLLSIVYVCAWFYARAGQRDRLVEEWRERRPPLPEYRYVALGLEEAAPRLKRTLVLGVYVVPLTVLAAIIWWFDYA